MSRFLYFVPLFAIGCGMTPMGSPSGTMLMDGEEQTYRLDRLAIDADPADNHLPEALAGVDILLPDGNWSVDEFNAQLADNVANYSAVFLGVYAASPLHLHVSTGVVMADGSVAMNAANPDPLVGEIVGDDGFSAGPGDLTLDFIVEGGLAPVPLELLQTEATGTWGAQITGSFQAVIPLGTVIDNIVAPALPSEGYDVDGDGTNETPDEVLDFVWSLAPSIGDVTLDDGTPGISARLDFAGSPAELPQ